MQVNTLFYIFIFLCIVPINVANAAAKRLLFCYEDKEIAPMFLGAGQEIPTQRPGASADVLRLLDDAVDGVDIEFVRKPWRRCLKDLESNKVNAVIASFREGREQIAVYPMDEDAKPNAHFAISRFGSCLLGRDIFRSQWQSRDKFNTKTFTIAVPSGYGLSAVLKKEPLFVHETVSKESAFELLNKGVVDSSIDICQVDKIKASSYPYSDTDVKALFPPYEFTLGYLVFSHQFYENHPTLSHKMWQWVSEFDSAPIYIDYLNSAKQPQN